jgi:hypothetical protein
VIAVAAIALSASTNEPLISIAALLIGLAAFPLQRKPR